MRYKLPAKKQTAALNTSNTKLPAEAAVALILREEQPTGR
jgi:hypothetical protein